MLTYRDETGRNVHVYADHPISRADAERIRGEARDAGRLARIEGEKASAAGERARADGERARAAGERARFEADRARIEADRARMEGLAAADAARSEARIVREQVLRDSDGRDYASLGSKDVRVFRRDGEAPEVWIDGEHVPTPPLPPGMARGELRQLREEVRALREQVAQLAADLRRERSAR